MRRLYCIAVVASLVPILFWINNFYHLPISDKPIDWSTFSNYINGIMTPFFALISVILLLSNMREQTKQLQETKRENEKQVQITIRENEKQILYKNIYKNQDISVDYIRSADSILVMLMRLNNHMEVNSLFINKTSYTS